jgi:hypothetical protein
MQSHSSIEDESFVEANRKQQPPPPLLLVRNRPPKENLVAILVSGHLPGDLVAIITIIVLNLI